MMTVWTAGLAAAAGPTAGDNNPAPAAAAISACSGRRGRVQSSRTTVLPSEGRQRLLLPEFGLDLLGVFEMSLGNYSPTSAYS